MLRRYLELQVPLSASFINQRRRCAAAMPPPQTITLSGTGGHLGIGPASDALQAKMQGQFILSQRPSTRDYVLDVPFATYEVHCEGEHGKLPIAAICFDDRSTNLDPNAPRTFVVNANNSISPSKASPS